MKRIFILNLVSVMTFIAMVAYPASIDVYDLDFNITNDPGYTNKGTIYFYDMPLLACFRK